MVHIGAREVGEGRTARQPGQVRKEAALTSQGGSLSNLPLTRLGRQRPGERKLEFAFARAAVHRAKQSLRCSAIDLFPPREGVVERFALPCRRSCSRADGLPYRVLARKYRPMRFEDLIGQEPMVRTLANSFAASRIHQAYILTGVRGVGKTTTARILARAFNYSLPGKIDRPSVDMPELGVHCQAIMESRHVDVIEMDAASHTGIDDVREIIENARYRPVSARTKVYIIDEVHMLSKQAFNGLLKTLEEPPEHVKFLFATTEIEKVPITVRSRCLRFDLRRIESGLMIAPSEQDLRGRGRRCRAGGAGADRPRRRRLGARRAVAARSGDRAWRRRRRARRSPFARCSASPTGARSSSCSSSS